MKRILQWLLIVLTVTTLSEGLSIAFPPFYVTPEVYKMTVNKVEWYHSETNTWVVVGSGNQVFDIASAAVGAQVGSYAAGAAIPEGTYTQVRVTISTSMKIKATTPWPGGGFLYTTGDQLYEPNSGETWIVASGTGPSTEGTVITNPHGAVDGYMTYTDNVPTPIIVKKGSTQRLRVEFDITDAAAFWICGEKAEKLCAYGLKPTVTYVVNP